MGFLTRAFVPRSVRRAAHPVRTAKRAATPRVVKQAQRSLHPVSNAIYSAQRSLNTKPRKRKSLTNTQAERQRLRAPEPDSELAPESAATHPLAWTLASIGIFFVTGSLLGWGWAWATVPVVWITAGMVWSVQQSGAAAVLKAVAVVAAILAVWCGVLTLIFGFAGMIATTVVVLIIAGVALTKRMGI